MRGPPWSLQISLREAEMSTGNIVLVVILVIVFSAPLLALTAFIWRLSRTHFEFVENVKKDLYVLAADLAQIAASKRLSVILTVEAKAGIKVPDPQQFEPNRKVLRAKMLACLGHELDRKTPGETGAYCVLNRSGFELFVESEVRSNAQKALGRLIANGDEAGAREFVNTLADAL